MVLAALTKLSCPASCISSWFGLSTISGNATIKNEDRKVRSGLRETIQAKEVEVVDDDEADAVAVDLEG